MKEIWKVIAEMCLELHPDRIGTVSTKISTLVSPNDFEKARTNFGPGADKKLIDRLGKAWKNTPDLSPIELAAALRGASGTAQLMEKREAVEMVWTGPFTGLVASRHTEQVLLEVIASTSQRLFLVSFVAYDIDTIVRAIQELVLRNVEIDILLESSSSHGGKVDIDSVRIFSELVPSANIYVWNSEAKSKDKWNGAVHAKCAVSDGNLAFITSANLTGAAMERNMELGVLVRGGRLPDELHRHLEALVKTEIVSPVSKF